jgi:hypothetical protein
LIILLQNVDIIKTEDVGADDSSVMIPDEFYVPSIVKTEPKVNFVFG